ncbi:MAG: [protein-PII] uridylyltransferase [Coraliomargaritaceae bacterium]
MFLQENPLFRRLRKHAQKRLVFDPGVSRHKQLPAYKRFVALENEMLKRYHRRGEPGLKVCHARAVMVDVVIENLFLAALDEYSTREGRLPCKLAIVATGGYGRGELNPHSDIDIMLLYPEKINNKKRFEVFQSILTEEILYPLWDLGWKVGHASRNAKEVIEEARAEIQSKNALLESRFICGSEPIFEDMMQRLSQYCETHHIDEYIQQRLLDEKARHEKYGNTAYLQEPDIKNGVGGLRDFQNILWTANLKFGYRSFKHIEKAKMLRRDERIAMEKAYEFLLRTRTEVHLNNRRPTDKLDLELQPVIAEGLLYKQEDIFQRVEAFMKDYYSAARTIFHTSEYLKKRLALNNLQSGRWGTRISFKEALRAHQHRSVRKIDGFLLDEGVLTAGAKNVFKEDPERLIRIFRYKQQFSASFDSELQHLLSRSIPMIEGKLINSPSAAESFLSILREPGQVYPILLSMHEIGVLGRYLPEFGQLTCMVQHEYYHRYTADMHVLRTIKHLDNVFLKADSEAALYEKELRNNDDPLLLYLILLLHDIGKAEGIKDHDQAGVRLAKPILDRFSIAPQAQEQILFIIRHHLEMARIWQRYDLDDPQTAASFAKFMEDPEKLRLLYVHTYCDARGTAPTLWNNYKESMHRTLFHTTLEQFSDSAVLERKRKDHIAMLNQELFQRNIEGVSKEEIEAHFTLLPERYFVNTNAEQIELHLQMVHRLLNQIQEAESVGALSPVIDWRDDRNLNMTIVNVVTWDRAGLFYKLAGALTLAGVNILSTRAISRNDHISVDTFYIIDPQGGVVSNPEAESIFRKYLEDSLVRGVRLMDSIEALESQPQAKNGKSKELLPAPFPPSVDVYHELSLKRTIIEVQATDKAGLLYRLARLIFRKGFDITFARIATEHGVAMDTFYIEKVEGTKTTDNENLLELREELEQIVQKLS